VGGVALVVAVVDDEVDDVDEELVRRAPGEVRPTATSTIVVGSTCDDVVAQSSSSSLPGRHRGSSADDSHSSPSSRSLALALLNRQQ